MSISSWQIHLPRSEFNWLPNGQRSHSHIGIPFLWPFVAAINISKASVASVTIHIHISDHGGKNGETVRNVRYTHSPDTIVHIG